MNETACCRFSCSSSPESPARGLEPADEEGSELCEAADGRERVIAAVPYFELRVPRGLSTCGNALARSPANFNFMSWVRSCPPTSYPLRRTKPLWYALPMRMRSEKARRDRMRSPRQSTAQFGRLGGRSSGPISSIQGLELPGRFLWRPDRDGLCSAASPFLRGQARRGRTPAFGQLRPVTDGRSVLPTSDSPRTFASEEVDAPFTTEGPGAVLRML
jgi:hypothetical protein